MNPHAHLITPYLVNLQKLALESELLGFTGLARGCRGLLIKETLQMWLGPRNDGYEGFKQGVRGLRHKPIDITATLWFNQGQ